MPRRATATPTRTSRPPASPPDGDALFPPARHHSPGQARPARPTRPGLGDILRSLLALVSLVGFVAGIPAMLWTWRGYPLPTTWQPGRWWTLLQAGYIHPDLAPNTLATLGWLLWAWITLCLAWEITTQATSALHSQRHRARAAARHLPAEPETRARSSTQHPSGTRRHSGRPEARAATSTPGRPAGTPPAAGRPGGVTRPAAGGRRGAPAPRAVRRGAARWVATAGIVFTLLSSRAALAATPATTAPHTGAPTTAATAPAHPGSTLTPTRAPWISGPATDPRLTAGNNAAATATGNGAAHVPHGWLPALEDSSPPRTSAASSTPPYTTAAPQTANTPTGRPELLIPTSTSHTVAPGDTLWAVAADAYRSADDTTLPVIVDIVFTTNHGTTDPAGHRLTNPDLINPGMALALPTLDPTGHPSPTPPPPANATPRPAPAPGTPSPAIPPPPTTATPPPGTATSTPGRGPALPTPTRPAPTTPATTTAPGDHAPPTTTAPTTYPADRHDAVRWLIGLGLGGTLLAAAVLTAVAQRRARRDRQVTVDTTAPPPDPDAAAIHTALLATTPPGPTIRLDEALRDLASLHTDPTTDDGPLPQVVLARPDGTLDVYLADPIPTAAPPWQADAHGQVWTLPHDAPLPPTDPGLPPPCPTLVQLGTLPDGAAVYADLEALGTLTLDPNGHGTDATTGLARALATTLALTPLAATPTVHTYGLDPDGLIDEDRIYPAATLTHLAATVLGEVSHLRDALATVGATTTFTARATVPTDNWDPVIALVATPPTTDHDTDDLTDLATYAADEGTGLALIQPATPTHTSTWRLTLLPTPHPAHSQTRADADGAAWPTATQDTDADSDNRDDAADLHVADDNHTTGYPDGADDTSGPVGIARWRLDPLNLILTPTTLAQTTLDALCLLLADAAQPPIPAPRPAGDTPVTEAFDTPPAPAQTPPPDDPEPSRPPGSRSTPSPLPFGALTGSTTAVVPASPSRAAPPTTSPSATATTPAPTAAASPTTTWTSPAVALATAPANGHAPTTTPPYIEPDWQVRVTLLGPLDAVNRTGQHPTGEHARTRTLEILAWLATHRGRTRTNLVTAIWPNAEPETRTVNNQLGRARRALVHLAGEHARAWIPAAQTVLRLDPAVTTDLDLLQHRLDYARTHRHHPHTAIPVLTDALTLITGTPNTAPWIDAELGSQLTTTAVRAALLLAELHLHTDNPDAALDATTQGLAIMPAHPGLFALRLRAHAASGDLPAATADYHAYQRAEQSDPDWNGDTNPDLVHLHRTLQRGAASLRGASATRDSRVQ
ncbi:hypothetical protein [Pseudofrankia sp. BMG5.36]|uniref:LysM peptidoglycan-binding domain-containing protein n=1 Tax=Pseudofrankia sp. BMG5.36 TaxID=1834512 RepID=UPI0008D8E80C|nr:hypothetical protein [Pseudofrankia sp. BMG5.36]OHV64187.1 hypothetical protein BCD48_37700 [Pseudofrankia sp. BMG5.36]